jgi:lantibiotic modifying enzyme
MRDHKHLEEIVGSYIKQSNDYGVNQWIPSSNSSGDAAIALLFGQMDRCFPKNGWDDLAHSYIVPAGRFIENEGYRIHLGMFGGLAGLCFAVNFLSHDGLRYQKFSMTLDELLIQRLAKTIRLPEPFIGKVAFSDYDLINGPAGIGAYLLLRYQTNKEAALALESTFDRLLFLSEYQNDKLRFFIPPELQATARHLERFPDGCTDCGLAHGVPGPLAFMSLAYLNGVRSSSSSEAIRRIADWLLTQRYYDEWGVNWPYAVGPHNTSHEKFTRAAWCYGAPGVARALWLAGSALQDGRFIETALEAMHTVRRRPIEMRGIPSPILCHGIAGLLQITLRFANDTDDVYFYDMASELIQQLLSLFEPESLLGFRNIQSDGCKIDDPGILEGSAGVILTLLAAVTDTEPVWDRMLLLS